MVDDDLHARADGGDPLDELLAQGSGDDDPHGLGPAVAVGSGPSGGGGVERGHDASSRRLRSRPAVSGVTKVVAKVMTDRTNE